MMRGVLLVGIVLTSTYAAELRADAWDRLYGQWAGHGEVNGMQAEVVFQFSRTLDGRGRQLRFENTMTGNDGAKSIFRADAYYMCDDAARTCKGHWYDSRGVMLPVTVATQDDRLVVDWGDEATERGRTTYLVTPDCHLKVTDEVQGKDETLRVFGRTVSRHSGEAEHELNAYGCVAPSAVPGERLE
jgi:hypothetical protein